MFLGFWTQALQKLSFRGAEARLYSKHHRIRTTGLVPGMDAEEIQVRFYWQAHTKWDPKSDSIGRHIGIHLEHLEMSFSGSRPGSPGTPGGPLLIPILETLQNTLIGKTPY